MPAILWLPKHKPWSVPTEVAACPICDAPIAVQFEAWEQDDDGSWIVERIDVDCTTGPDFDDDGYEDWFRGHWRYPYIDWLPVEERVLGWLRANVRFSSREVDRGGSS